MNQKISPTVSIIIVLVVAIVAGALIMKNQPGNNYNDGMMANQQYMKITSNIFPNNGTIPVAYTCNGAGTQPPLQVSGVSGAAKSLALIVFDPDAGKDGFVHWVVWGIDPKISVIENGKIPGAIEGYTGKNAPGWIAPCPPTGIHHYHFNLYALDTSLSIPLTTTRTALITAMQGHVVGSASLIGLYGKGN